jgi:hypothetical protein
LDKSIVRRGQPIASTEELYDRQITVTLPTEVLQRAEQLARCTGRSVDQLLAETIELSLRPLGTCSLPEEGRRADRGRKGRSGEFQDQTDNEMYLSVLSVKSVVV